MELTLLTPPVSSSFTSSVDILMLFTVTPGEKRWVVIWAASTAFEIASPRALSVTSPDPFWNIVRHAST